MSNRDLWQGSTSGFWVDDTTFKIFEVGGEKTDTWKFQTKDVLGNEIHDGEEVNEWTHLMREYTEKQWKTKAPKTPHTPSQRRELGSILRDISNSQDYRMDALHGRYWDLGGHVNGN